MIVNVNSDIDVVATNNTATGLRTQDVLREVQIIDSSALLQSQSIISADAGETSISLIRWEVPDVIAPGLPNQQTLERLVCAAIITAYPQRGQCVQDWLDARHDPSATSVKAFVWSHMAGWYPEHGCDDFYRCLWDDKKVAAELKARLEVSDSWQTVLNMVT